MSDDAMLKHWDIYGRQGIDLASTATSFGFSAIKIATRFGFSVTRGIATTAVGLTATIVDHALFGGSTVASPLLGTAVSTAITIVEQITLAPIFLSEYITSTSLVAAHSSIDVLSVIIPGSSEASFSLASFITLVKREWTGQEDNLPENKYGLTQVARAVVGWAALQGVTHEWQERISFKYLRELRVEPRQFDSMRSRRSSTVRVTSDVIFPGNELQVILADIGEVPPNRTSSIASSLSSIHTLPPTKRRHHGPIPLIRLSNNELKSTLRRLSKLVLAGYGGASLLFFGISPSSASGSSKPTTFGTLPVEKAAEEAQLAHAIDASEAEAKGDGEMEPPPPVPEYSWWDVLLGKHDHEIFETAANHHTIKSGKRRNKARARATAVVGSERLMPRFWVLTDHGRSQIVLVLRGTMSLNELAVDLTCESEEFVPAKTPPPDDDVDLGVPGKFAFPTQPPLNHRDSNSSSHEPAEGRRYSVHSGFLRMAKMMGSIGKPVHVAVQEALYHNPDYELVLCGHSLGAGVASILGMMWADPRTCLTVPSSGLPPGRRLSVYCFAPPAVADAHLGKVAHNMIVSFVHSHDVVSRLSLGSVRDIKNAALWLCHANEEAGGAEGYDAVTKRARQWTAKGGGGVNSADDEESKWFVAVRKTLEANMHNVTLFPPGRVLWAMRDNDLHPSHRLYGSNSKHDPTASPDKLRLFEVDKVEAVFGQILFARDMLSAHMPQNYDRVLHDLL